MSDVRRFARELVRADTELHCEAEDVDKLLAGIADDMAAENMLAATIF